MQPQDVPQPCMVGAEPGLGFMFRVGGNAGDDRRELRATEPQADDTRNAPESLPHRRRAGIPQSTMARKRGVSDAALGSAQSSHHTVSPVLGAVTAVGRLLRASRAAAPRPGL
jgi:hypothetical protein